jgi:hypothetical protein
MQTLDQWLSVATRGLCEAAAERVRTEIGEHYACALESAGTVDVNPLDAERRTVAALGDPKIANREYRRVLLTAGEDDLLRGLTSWWASWGWLLMGIPLLLAAVALKNSALIYVPAMVLIEGVLRDFPARPIRAGWMVRIARWGTLAICLTLWFVGIRAGAPQVAMVVFVAVTIAHREYKYAVLRRKVPVEQWPRWLWV